MNSPKSLVSKMASPGMVKSILKGTPAPQRPAGGQSGYNAPRPPSGMATRPPLIANKARGTMSSANRAAMAGMY